MVADAAFTFDRFAPPHLDDPYPLCRDAREQAGVFHADAFDVWVVIRHDDVRDVLTDPARFSSAYLIRTPHTPPPASQRSCRKDIPRSGSCSTRTRPSTPGPAAW